MRGWRTISLRGSERRDGRKSYRFFALEIDRGTMPVTRSNNEQTSYLTKLKVYRDLIEGQVHRAHLGVPNFLVLTVTTNEERVSKMMRAFEQAGGSAAMLFQSLGTSGNALLSPSPDFLCADWHRCTGLAMSIASP
jgi:hypothetical protein